MTPSIYVIGALRNPQIPLIAQRLRQEGFDAFDAWWSASEDADEWWQHHEQKIKDVPYRAALRGLAAEHVFFFDKQHLDRCDSGLLVLPAGKSAHIELGYLAGQEKPTWVLFEKEPERWDVMYRFASDVCYKLEEVVERARIHFDLR